MDESQTISGNNFDREKIQVKIQQLERNLKNFNSNKNTLNFHTTDEQTDVRIHTCKVTNANYPAFQKTNIYLHTILKK